MRVRSAVGEPLVRRGAFAVPASGEARVADVDVLLVRWMQREARVVLAQVRLADEAVLVRADQGDGGVDALHAEPPVREGVVDAAAAEVQDGAHRVGHPVTVESTHVCRAYHCV